MISFYNETPISSQMAKCFQLLRHLINSFMLWTDPCSLSARSPHARSNPILILRQKYEYCQRACKWKFNQSFDYWYLWDTAWRKNKIERVSEMLLDQMDHLYYSPRTRKLRIIITPLLGELIQFAREKQNESMLLWLESRKESEFEWYLQRD